MAFIELTPEDPGDDERRRAIYEQDTAEVGYLPDYTRAFARRPDVYEAWNRLLGAVKAEMDPRRYELATLAAARALRSSYCMLAHGKVAAQRGFLEPDELIAVAEGRDGPGLDELDVAVIDLAEKVASDASSVTADDVGRLRELGLGDDEIFDVVATAALRCFLSKAVDGLGVQPDAAWATFEPQALREALTVGRPIAEG